MLFAGFVYKFCRIASCGKILDADRRGTEITVSEGWKLGKGDIRQIFQMMLGIERGEGIDFGLIGKVHASYSFAVILMDGKFAVEDTHRISGVLGTDDDLGGYGGILGMGDRNRHNKISLW